MIGNRIENASKLNDCLDHIKMISKQSWYSRREAVSKKEKMKKENLGKK